MVSVTAYERTPNPHALRLTLDSAISDRPRSFLSKEDAKDDPIAGPIFAAGGIRAILINGDWMTVNKQPDADWKPIKALVERILSEVTPA